MKTTLPALLLAGVLPLTACGEGPLDRALALYNQNELDDAYPLFEAAVEATPRDADARAWLAETARRRRSYDEAYDAAATALALAPCHSFAHTVLGFLYQPIYGGWERTDADSSWAHLRRAVECDPADGNAWIALWVEAIRRGEHDWETRALESLVTEDFVPPSVLAFNRWALRSLPENALFLTNGDWDTFPALALQITDRVRPDVAVVNLSMLNLPWYARLMTDRHDIALDFTDDEMQPFHGTGRLPDAIVDGWRTRSVNGDLGRPLAAATTVARSRLEGGPGAFRYIGPAFVLLPDSAAPDTAAMRRALSEVRGADFQTPEVSTEDRSAVRRVAATRRGLARAVLHAALEYGSALLEAGRSAEAREMVEWSERFVREARLGSERQEEVERLRQAVGP